MELEHEIPWVVDLYFREVFQVKLIFKSLVFFSMAYEKDTGLIHDKDFEDNNSETAEVEIKYIAPVAIKKDNQNNSKNYSSKKEKKNFSNKNFDTPLQMSNVDCELMIDDYSSDSMSDDISYNDTQPILT